MKTAVSRVLHMGSNSQGVCGRLEEAKGSCSRANPMTHLRSYCWAPSVHLNQSTRYRCPAGFSVVKTRIYTNLQMTNFILVFLFLFRKFAATYYTYKLFYDYAYTCF